MLPSTSRATLLARLGSERFDVLIIGGGIVGAGIARDAAMRGLKVALIEQGDFASGTSSKTSKLIHGGLRYLEHGHVRLVAESLRERHILRTTAPQLVRPLSLLLPLYKGQTRSPWKVRLGLTLYDVLALGRNIRFHQMLSARRGIELEPALRQDGLRAVGIYPDCQMDDARLCLANILQAVSFGAVCCNYVTLRGFLKANGQLVGGVGEDVLGGGGCDIHARVVVNATGPWADRVRALSRADAAKRLAPTKGVHLIMPRLAQEALFVEAKRDRRMLFLLPWGAYTLVGTTESAVTGSLDALSATAHEVDYLLEEVNRVLPGSHVAADDVIATFAGARPLLRFGGTSTSASREHRIDVDPSGLVSILGGKYTTYRLMAKQAVDMIVSRSRWAVDRCLTDQVNVLETVHPVSMDRWHALTQAVDPDLLARLLGRYGAGTFDILRLLEVEPRLGHPLCPHHEYIEAEVIHALQHELACTMTDVLARRTRVAWSSCQGLDALSRLTELFQTYGGLTPDHLKRQLEDYQEFLGRGLGFRSRSVTTGRWRGMLRANEA